MNQLRKMFFNVRARWVFPRWIESSRRLHPGGALPSIPSSFSLETILKNLKPKNSCFPRERPNRHCSSDTTTCQKQSAPSFITHYSTAQSKLRRYLIVLEPPTLALDQGERPWQRLCFDSSCTDPRISPLPVQHKCHSPSLSIIAAQCISEPLAKEIGQMSGSGGGAMQPFVTVPYRVLLSHQFWPALIYQHCDRATFSERPLSITNQCKLQPPDFVPSLFSVTVPFHRRFN